MSKILIIPDVHSRKFWRETINTENVDKVIFLGDYIDPYPNEIAEDPESMECKTWDDAESNLKMLNDIVNLKKNDPNKYILLTGNHTDGYIWKDFARATRSDRENYDKYHNFFLENLNLFNLVWIENDVIFSHAGIVQGWAERVWEVFKFPENEIPSIMEVAKVLQDTPLTDYDENYVQVISDISHHRWGDFLYGSCEWADIREHFNYTELTPKGEKGIYQVFGHTQLQKPFINEYWACLDCRKGFIIDTNTKAIKEC